MPRVGLAAEFPAGVRRAREPRRTPVRGRNWDTCDVVLPDGTVVKGHYDFTWGTGVFFPLEGAWYRVPVDDFGSGSGVLKVDLREGRKRGAP